MAERQSGWWQSLILWMFHKKKHEVITTPGQNNDRLESLDSGYPNHIIYYIPIFQWQNDNQVGDNHWYCGGFTNKTRSGNDSWTQQQQVRISAVIIKVTNPRQRSGTTTRGESMIPAADLRTIHNNWDTTNQHNLPPPGFLESSGASVTYPWQWWTYWIMQSRRSGSQVSHGHQMITPQAFYSQFTPLLLLTGGSLYTNDCVLTASSCLSLPVDYVHWKRLTVEAVGKDLTILDS